MHTKEPLVVRNNIEPPASAHIAWCDRAFNKTFPLPISWKWCFYITIRKPLSTHTKESPKYIRTFWVTTNWEGRLTYPAPQAHKRKDGVPETPYRHIPSRNTQHSMYPASYRSNCTTYIVYYITGQAVSSGSRRFCSHPSPLNKFKTLFMFFFSYF